MYVTRKTVFVCPKIGWHDAAEADVDDRRHHRPVRRAARRLRRTQHPPRVVQGPVSNWDIIWNDMQIDKVNCRNIVFTV